jgi:ATP-dependent helicase/nuclease subunit A
LNRTREGLAYLLQRRLVAWDVLDRFLDRGPADLSADDVCRRAVESLIDLFGSATAREKFLSEGPVRQARYLLLAQDLRRLESFRTASNAAVRGLINRTASHFLKADGKPRQTDRIHPYTTEDYPSTEAGKRHRLEAVRLGLHVENIVRAFSRDLNVVLARGIRGMFAIALAHYRTALNERSLLDFSDVLERAVKMLGRMDEFSQSRYRLEGRYHHVLVDEFQDTSRKQWELISLLVKAWGEGIGLVAQPSIFIVGDRKQSIYRFRDAEVAVLQEAGAFISGLRPGTSGRRSISRSFRAVPELLSFVNELFAEVGQNARRPDDFKYDSDDRFPVDLAVTSPKPATDRQAGEGGSLSAARQSRPTIGLITGADPDECASAVASEIARILDRETVRDKQTGLARRATPGDIGILFRSRASHREFEAALEARGIPTYVYKGLGFFDSDEIKDLSALIRYLANPSSELRAAAFLRSRFVRLSDAALAALAPRLAAAITDSRPPEALAVLLPDDRAALEITRLHAPRWLAHVDRIPPADLVEQLIPETAYAYELRGARRHQAWENVKKMRGLIRRIQNRGYATLARIADHLDSLTAGDESNAVLEALDAVNLMTVHAAKGLEFPIVFVVNLAKGASGFPRPVRVLGEDVSVGPFVSDSDEEERFREREETKRLLYVALTRARDRLYLGTVLKDGAFAIGRGSLSDVLPESLRSAFVRAAQSAEAAVEWTAQSGRVFTLGVCRVGLPPEGGSHQRPDLVVSAFRRKETATSDNFEPLDDDSAIERVPATGVLDAAGYADPSRAAHPDDALVGTLVHRLLQLGSDQSAAALLRPEERATAADAEGSLRRAHDVWRRLTHDPEIAEVLVSGERLFEVPFSSIDPDHPGRVLRGTIDCLVCRPDGSVVVLEFKTGTRARGHQAQLAAYLDAAKGLFPGATVTGRVVYSQE